MDDVFGIFDITACSVIELLTRVSDGFSAIKFSMVLEKEGDARHF